MIALPMGAVLFAKATATTKRCLLLRNDANQMNGINTITRRRALQLLAGATFMTTALPYRLAAEDDNKRNRKILFFTKSSGFEHDLVKRTGGGPSLSETALTNIGRTRGFEVVATKDGRIFDSDLAQYDAFFFFTTGDLTEAGTDKMPPMSAQGKEALLAAIRDGKGFLGIHSASDTFHSKGKRFQTQEQPDPYIAMLGGEFLSHGSQQEARVRVVDSKFPGLQGSNENFTIKEEWYSLKNFSRDIHVLLVLETEGMQDSDYTRPPFPIAWARKRARAASTSTPWATVTRCGKASVSGRCLQER
jgi:hypothetical protein